MSSDWIERRILIWGKTYPEISSKYYETVCTGGVLEDGSFIRLYPIPFRYLADTKIFTKYQWIKARIKKSKSDPRPESYKIDPESIQAEISIPSDRFGWNERSKSIFKNDHGIFDSVEQLFDQNSQKKVSMGFVRPKRINKIEIVDRPSEDYDTFLRKLTANQERLKQAELFPVLSVEELKKLQYISQRFKIHWHCSGATCRGHKMSILDWEVYELARRTGMVKASQKLEEILNLETYNTGFFLGNFRLHPTNFAIGGIWYPKKNHLAPNLTLFE